ncbi:hypothetical protein JAAARDRAFT_608667 [Jaapia argillacea MUCL 33604]|uniref:Uncharacterized protein n=1 Tax=Jaapia argillacea MUCL 33604 TaxID=933084 RepID=A0A067QD62_9AGAM|nr:hypothetical protein JAAARDRAFT_608667 [Jaapia argillacea MUCL 33604]
MSPNKGPHNDQEKGKTSSEPMFSIPAEDVFDLLKANGDGGDDFELETASTSTLSDNPGPGFTIGKWIGKAGRKLEIAAGSVAERLRIGPNAVMEDIIDGLSGVERHRRPFLQAPRPFRSLIPIALSHSTSSTSSEESVSKIQARLPTYYRKLVDYLLDPNPNNQFLALYYITTLIYTDPRARTIFLDLGIFDILERRQDQLLSLPRRHPQRDLLLAPSRRALVSLSESEILTVIQNLDYGGRRYDLGSLPDHCAESIATLINFTTTSDYQILAGLQISNLERIGSAHPTLLEAIKPEVVYQWAELSQSDDPILSHIYSCVLSEFASVCSDICGDRFWDCYVVPVCQSYIDAIGSESAEKIMNRILPNKNYLAALLTPETRSKLPTRSMASIHAQQRNRTGSPEWPSLIQLFAGPFFSLWGAFLRQWTFDPREARHNFYHNISSEPWDLPSRRLPPRIRTSLCRQLVTVAVNSECSVEDITQVADEDVDCYDEILDILGNIVDNGDQVARRSALRIKLELEAWYKKRASKDPFTF